MGQHYDVAVVGTQTAGLIAAALLAKRERRVVVLDHGENARFYRHHGVHLPLVPTLVPSFEDSPSIKRVHDELGLSPDIRNAVELREPAFQAVMAQHRIDVLSKRPAFLDELGHEFPELVAPVRRFLDRLFEIDREISDALGTLGPLPPRTWVERANLRRKLKGLAHLDAPFESGDLLAGIPGDHPVRDLLLGPLTFFGHLEPDAPSALHAVRLIARYFRGVLTFKDRLGGLHKMLHDAASESGVTFRNGALVKAFELEGRKVTRIVAEKDRSVTADFVIYNALAPLEELLPPGKASAKVSEEQKSVRPAGSLLVCNLLVRRKVIPCGMA
ncbi:MAG: NAD(P)-binding protein, partial [Myxococcota bacterium]